MGPSIVVRIESGRPRKAMAPYVHRIETATTPSGSTTLRRVPNETHSTSASTAERRRHEHAQIAQHAVIDGVLQVRPPRDVEAQAGAGLGGEDRFDALLEPGVEELLVRHLAEADVHRRGLAVVRDDRAPVQRIGERVLAQRSERRWISGDVVDEAPDVDPLALGVPVEGDHVGEALDAPHLG